MEKVNKKEKQVKGKKKLSKGALVLIISLIIILIPCLIFGGILISAALESGKPVDGNRFKGDLNPAITSSNTSSIKNSIEALSGVEKCDIELTSAQYRVNVDTVDTLTDKQIEDLCVDIYNIVNKELPMATYFTASSSEKMYDLAVNVYNKIDDDNIYYILTKNSKMDTYSVQCVSSAVDEELASDLRGENDIEEPTEKDDDAS
ncbi:MAG: hypothetical protein PUD31_07370 [Solobacterium sp.]|nr:hypothetical protein [Solobacterium sp.]MDY2953542.1 hypothetical protein [Erysipelotrichaceae bacterium]MCI6846846.1 hypothetical protein [Solobacterium sp.]MCI6877436.1 hypothetical protein [Solobacterium sp.]MCI7157763.1 hypothetical protein [Solobacterium sp.]